MEYTLQFSIKIHNEEFSICSLYPIFIRLLNEGRETGAVNILGEELRNSQIILSCPPEGTLFRDLGLHGWRNLLRQYDFGLAVFLRSSTSGTRSTQPREHNSGAT
jgi:hypothetical protein